LEFTKCIIIQFYFIFTMRALNVNHKLPRDLELIRIEPVLANKRPMRIPAPQRLASVLGD
jgi:hypothetical protein